MEFARRPRGTRIGKGVSWTAQFMRGHVVVAQCHRVERASHTRLWMGAALNLLFRVSVMLVLRDPVALSKTTMSLLNENIRLEQG